MKKFILTTIIALCAVLMCNAQTTPFYQEGTASWYGTEFDGQTTASGEVFNSALYTAAHPELPFNTLLTITNKNNNKKVTVRVNDRGPFVAGRIVDVSQAAAQELDMLVTGTAPVSITLAAQGSVPGPAASAPPLPSAAPPLLVASSPPPVEPLPVPAPPISQTPSAQPPLVTAPPAAEPPVVSQTSPAAQTPPTSVPAVSAQSAAAFIKPGLPPPGTNKRYRLQVGAFRVPKNAVDTFNKLKSVGLNPSYERVDNDLYRVVLAGIAASDVQSVAEKIGLAGFTEAFIREER